MPPLKLPQLPFLTREMLKFGHKANLELRVVVQSTVTQTIELNGITREGTFSYRIKAVGDGTQDFFRFKLSDFPIWMNMIDWSTVINPGECYVSVEMWINRQLVRQFMAGYVYQFKDLSYPQSHIEHMRAGPGRIEAVNGVDPAAGGPVTQNVPNGEVWKLMGANVTLVTDGNAADRVMQLEISSGNFNLVFSSATNHVANTTRLYTFAAVGSDLAVSADDDIIVPIPSNLILPETFNIRMDTVDDQVGDDLDTPVFFIERWLMNP